MIFRDSLSGLYGIKRLRQGINSPISTPFYHARLCFVYILDISHSAMRGRLFFVKGTITIF